MFIEYTANTTLPPTAIWQVWEEVGKWGSWDPEITSFSLQGPFEEKTKGTMVLTNGRILEVEMVDVHPNQSFSLKAHRAGLNILITYQLAQQEGLTYVTKPF